MKPSEIEAQINRINQQFDIQQNVKESMQYPVKDVTQLFDKFAEPKEMDEADSVSRELPTGNFDEETYQRIVTIGIIRSSFIQFKKTFLGFKKLEDGEIKNLNKEEKAEYLDKLNANIWIDSTIKQMGDAMTVLSTASKGRRGWLGGLIITSKRIGEVNTSPLFSQKRSVFDRIRGR